MQALEHPENLLGIRIVEAESVVLHRYNPAVLALARSRNMYLRRFTRSPVFDRIAYQVLEHLGDACGVHVERRQNIMRQRRPGLFYGYLKVG